MVAAVEPEPFVPVPVEEATMNSRERTRMKLTLEIVACIAGVLFASWSGPAVHDYLAPKFKIICPICNWGPNEPRQLH